MHRSYAPDITTQMILPDEEAQHCVRVLRLKEGEEVEVVDGKGHLHLCRILNANAKNCAVEIVGTTDVKPHWGCRITVAIAPTKNMDRMEWMAEKVTEMGVDRIVPLLCRYSERKVLKTERLRKILVAAMKQSLKATLPQLDDRAARRTAVHCLLRPRNPEARLREGMPSGERRDDSGGTRRRLQPA